MTIQHDLSVIGFGYLQEVVSTGNKTTAHIYRLPTTQNSSKRGETLMFNCLVSDPLIKAELGAFQSALAQGCAVIVKFAAQYLETTGFLHCMAEGDPDHILNVSAKLTAISEIFVDGSKQPIGEGDAVAVNW